MTSIPMDLILDILSRLPAKSITRFLWVSKQWGSMLRGPYFTELFLTRSLARPRLLFALVRVRDSEWSFFSSPQPHNPYGKSSLVVGASFHMKLSKGISDYIGNYASGLIYIPAMWISKEDYYAARVICNPNTGQYAILPKLLTYKSRTSDSYLGFDPIDKQFKVLFINYPPDDDHHILTLGTGNMRWRKIQCPLTHYPIGGAICFNGVVFYFARKFDDRSYVIVVCFDVRSEKFIFIDAKHFGGLSYTKLLNYKGKLGGVSIKYANKGGFPLQLCMWVLEDVEKHELSKYVYTLQADNKVVKVNRNLFVVGMTATGEIVLSKRFKFLADIIEPFYVFYFNPERKTLLSVEIQGFEEIHGFGKLDVHRVYAFVDHVEDLKFNIMKSTCAETSINPPD